MIRIVISAVLLAASLAPAAAQDVIVDAAQDGLVARLTMANAPTVAWRFEKALPAPVDSVLATYNGRNVPITDVRTYPQAGDVTSALIILDNTGGDADPQAEVVRTLRARAALLYQSWTEQRAIALASTGNGLQVVIPDSSVPFSPVEALVGLGFGTAQSNLQAVIAEAVAQLGNNPDAARRTIFLFTDGHSETTFDFAALTTAAREAGVSVNIIVEPGRTADLPALQAFAESTGGFYVAGTAARPMLATPFFYVDSGATAQISLANERRYFWDEQHDLSVSFNYGDKRLVLTAPATVSDASFTETALYVWDNHGRTLGLVLAGAGWAVALVLMPFARVGRRVRVVSKPSPVSLPTGPSRSTDKTAPALPPKAALLIRFDFTDSASNYHNGTALDIDRITIGRARDNTIVVPSDSVSGHHAVIVRSEGGAFNLTNLSKTNPTLVNGVATEFARLASGDQLVFGASSASIQIGDK